jgi:hypothetical protein
MNKATTRQHPFLMKTAALVLSALLLVFTLGTQVSYAGGDPTGGLNDPEGRGAAQDYDETFP